MPMSNEELIRKATITADVIAAQGKLNPEQAEKFIDYVVDETKLKDHVRIVRFNPEQLNIEKIAVGNRVAMPKTEAVDPGLRRGVATSRVTLQPVEIMTPFEIGDIFREINVEGEDVEDHVIQMFARQMANDIEEVTLLGDTVGEGTLESNIIDGGDAARIVEDTYLGLMNGWLRNADTTHVVDANNASIAASVFTAALNEMPNKFKRDRGRLRWFCSVELEQLWLERLSGRATPQGDSAIKGVNVAPFGIPMVALPLMPFRPTVVQEVVIADAGATTLRYQNITAASETVALSTLASIPTTPATEGVDYTMDYVNGTIVGDAGGIYAGGATVKVTYTVGPQMLLTHEDNFIWAIGRDIRMESDRDIFKGVNQYAITTKIDCNFEETDAVVKVVEIAATL